MIKQALWHAVTGSTHDVPPPMVSKILGDAIINLDNSITSDFISLFPRDLRRLRNMTNSQIKQILCSGSSGEANSRRAARCVQGSTVLISLTDPRKRNLWVANLGDCQAGLPVFVRLTDKY
jgi:pyruvate dehydrogenase phosphatase